jgi:hypothetical protein
MSGEEFLKCSQRLRCNRPRQRIREQARVNLNRSGLLPPPTMVITHGSLKFGAVPRIVVRSLALYGRDP